MTRIVSVGVVADLQLVPEGRVWLIDGEGRRVAAGD